MSPDHTSDGPPPDGAMPDSRTPCAPSDATPWPFAIHVCSLNQLRKHAKRFEATHVVTLLEMCAKARTPSRVHPHNHLRLTFDDVEDPRHPYAPQRRHIDSLLAFGRTLPEGARVIVHCQAGQCRSTAGALALMVQAAGLEHAQMAMDAIIAQRPSAMPNPLVVQLADDALGASGRLLAVSEAACRSQEARLFGPRRASLNTRP